jgi:uncharacterized delta-60 repeat protein
MKLFSNLSLLTLVLLAFYSSPAQTCPNSPGCLDPTFNGTGKQVIVTSGNGNTADHDTVVQSDGKVVLLVDSNADSTTLIRVNRDGSPDDGSVNDSTPGDQFGTGGKVFSDWHYAPSLPRGFPYGLAIQVIGGEERIVIAGSWSVPLSRNTYANYLRVDRYLSNGQRDLSFGPDHTGTVVVNKPYGLAVAIQPDDNKIVTVGDAQAVVRLNEDGTVDTGFGPNGDGATGAGQAGWSIIALPNAGGILISGTYSDKSASYMCVSKLKPTGAVDENFGTAGRAIAKIYGRGSFGRAFKIAIDPFGNIVAGGIARPKGTSVNDFVALRLKATGQFDTSFNRTGWAMYDFSGGSDDVARSVVAQGDGKIVLTGYTGPATGGRDWGLLRFNFDGSVDTGFGTNGRVTTDFGGTSEYSSTSRLWVDPACNCEKIVMGGGTNLGGAFARYLTR